jgi:hypothetical protein
VAIVVGPEACHHLLYESFSAIINFCREFPRDGKFSAAMLWSGASELHA